MKLHLIVLAGCISVAVSIVCPQNYCDSVDCTEETNTPCSENAMLVPSSSFCGCCATCITQLRKGDLCMELLGTPPTAECGEGLSCNIKNVCE